MFAQLRNSLLILYSAAVLDTFNIKSQKSAAAIDI